MRWVRNIILNSNNIYQNDGFFNSQIFLKFILGMVKANYTYHLTQSFRFGPQIGLVANTYLEKLLGTQRQTLVGGKKKDFIIARRKIFKNLKKYKPVAVIARTNFKLFNKIVKLICDPESPPSVRFLVYDVVLTYNIKN